MFIHTIIIEDVCIEELRICIIYKWPNERESTYGNVVYTSQLWSTQGQESSLLTWEWVNRERSLLERTTLQKKRRGKTTSAWTVPEKPGHIEWFSADFFKGKLSTWLGIISGDQLEVMKRNSAKANNYTRRKRRWEGWERIGAALRCPRSAKRRTGTMKK